MYLPSTWLSSIVFEEDPPFIACTNFQILLLLLSFLGDFAVKYLAYKNIFPFPIMLFALFHLYSFLLLTIFCWCKLVPDFHSYKWYLRSFITNFHCIFSKAFGIDYRLTAICPQTDAGAIKDNVARYFENKMIHCHADLSAAFDTVYWVVQCTICFHWVIFFN